MFGYRVPSPDQAMLISGGKQKTEGAQFKVVIGHGAWVMPGFRKVRFLGLDLHKVEIEETCRSTEGILLNLKAVVAFKVQSDIPAVNAAAQRFLGEQRKGEMEKQVLREAFSGWLPEETSRRRSLPGPPCRSTALRRILIRDSNCFWLTWIRSLAVSN